VGKEDYLRPSEHIGLDWIGKRREFRHVISGESESKILKSVFVVHVHRDAEINLRAQAAACMPASSNHFRI